MLISLYEMELRATQGGPDQCNGGVASASHADSSAYKLFDDNGSSYWVNGGPSEASWCQYDFGEGGAVEVAEVRLLPRYASQSPQAFSLQYSDNGLDWFEEAAWTGVTDWIGGVEKVFSPPPPPAIMASAQNSHPFVVALTVASLQGYLAGDALRVGCAMPYALSVDASRQQPCGLCVRGQSSQRFGCWLASQQGHPFGILVSADLWQSWKRFVSRAILQTIHAQVDRGVGVSWALRHRLVTDHHQEIVATWRVVQSLGQGFDRKQYNDVLKGRCGYWDLSVPHGVYFRTPPLLTMNGLPWPCVSASMVYDLDTMFWSTQLHLARDADFGAMALDDPLIVQMGDDVYSLVVDGKRLDRAGPDQVVRMLSGISQTARHHFPRAEAVTQTWSTSVWARDVVETVLGESVAWDLPEWRIQADRLAVRAFSPLQVVQHIVEAAGGVVQTRPAGDLWVRPRFPVAVPDWSDGAVAHVLTDGADILEIVEVRQVHTRVDRVIVRDGPVTGRKAHLDLALDGREEGPNRGRTLCAPGESMHLVLTKGRGVEVTAVAASAGELLAARPTTWQQTEELAFVASNRALLTTPSTAIVSVLWLGTDLGVPSLQEDGVTLVTPWVGTAMARITYTVVAESHLFMAPPHLGGETHFPVGFSVQGVCSDADVLAFSAQRGHGIHPIREVVAPLLSDVRALRARAQAELDQSAACQEVQLTLLYRPGLEAGQLVAVQDGAYGRSFCALIVGVQHDITVEGWVSRLRLLK